MKRKGRLFQLALAALILIVASASPAYAKKKKKTARAPSNVTRQFSAEAQLIDGTPVSITVVANQLEKKNACKLM